MSAGDAIVALGDVAERARRDSFRAQHSRNERGWCQPWCCACRLAAKSRLYTRAEASVRFLVREDKAT